LNFLILFGNHRKDSLRNNSLWRNSILTGRLATIKGVINYFYEVLRIPAIGDLRDGPI